MIRPPSPRRLAWAGVIAVIASLPAFSARSQDIPPAPALFLAPEIKTAGAGIAVGPGDVLHTVAARYDTGGEGGVIYSVCASDCVEDGAWRSALLPVPGAITAEIALAPGGAPRLLIRTASADNSGGRDFLYAECGPAAGAAAPDACLDPSAWVIAHVASNHESAMGDFYELILAQRTFGLDPSGRPRFIYTDSDYFAEPDHYGAFYMSCEADCTDRRNWTETDLANHLEYRTEQFTRPVLAIGPSGSAHVLAWVYGFEPNGAEIPNDLYYYECPSNCRDRANWSRVSVINAGSGSYPSPTWDLALDPQGRPRAAVFVGGGATVEGIDYSLVYLWCDAACTSDRGWEGWLVFDGGYGENPALAIDAVGRPRIAFLSPDDLPVVAVCNEDCEGDQPVWDGLVFEAEADIGGDRPVALPFTCDGEVWNAMMPRIALNSGGAAIVAYDVSVRARCLYREFLAPEITFEFHEIWRGARLAFPAP